ncbi:MULTISPECIES: chaplin [unclassified Streptomyces]|uniref:chaplin n=1 Tax=unclassified Streptomyces TaxID=2593676 RepID=UPI002DD96761|nr:MULTISPECIES: chaplin [unclassified Streptomyces]
MRKALSKSMLVMAAASGILTAAGGYAQADASADGSAAGSPGVGSGNAVQVPVHVPVNVCGNTVNVVGLLNPAFGNTCENASDRSDDGRAQGASAVGGTSNSPGVLSGNLVQVPVDVPVNACGNTVDVVGALNPAVGNHCSNGSRPSTGEPPVEPPVVEPPVVEPPVVEPPVVEPPVVEPPVVEPPVVEPPVIEPPVVEPPVVEPPVIEPPVVEPPTVIPAGVNTPGSQLARTGAADLGVAAGGSAALLLGGTLLMRRARASRN